ncbi:MAG TPA: hypothetical protein VJN02_05280 [Gammaproteobacteria bacterium]|nr:hypothetical protein [Gammaproteobacteria bacterium]
MNQTLENIKHHLSDQLTFLLPRILTHVCRDETSFAYGSFDRDYWHYKIRDFSSVILQQGGYALYIAGQHPHFYANKGELNTLAKASCLFWLKRATAFRAFEEYYPWEEGYPPLAFSTLAVVKLIDAGIVQANKMFAGIAVSTKQLIKRFEAGAANQQIAGLAALAWIKKLYPDLITHQQFEKQVLNSLDLQRDEGWFMEYGGPDLGYLSVTLDCLWDLYDATGDKRFLLAANKALLFLSECVLMGEGSLGMCQARNTDYIVPYGIIRFIKACDDHAQLASEVFLTLFLSINKPHHFLYAIDERYLLHYIGHSFFRALLLLTDIHHLPSGKATYLTERLYQQAGIYLTKTDSHSFSLALNKGGVFLIKTGDRYAADYGWIVKSSGFLWITHWWLSNGLKWKKESNRFLIDCYLVRHKEIHGTPLKHTALRILSFLLGSYLIRQLKKRFIFSKKSSHLYFHREIICCNKEFIVKDTIDKLPKNAKIIRAGRSSKRHVASSDNFHLEDLALIQGIKRMESIDQVKGQFIAETRYIF